MSRCAQQSDLSASSLRQQTLDAGGSRNQLLTALKKSTEVPRSAFARRHVLLLQRTIRDQAV
jgi:hypothetical protein